MRLTSQQRSRTRASCTTLSDLVNKVIYVKLERGTEAAIGMPHHGLNPASPSPHGAEAGKQRSYHEPPISPIQASMQQGKPFKSQHATKSSRQRCVHLCCTVGISCHSSGRAPRPSPKMTAAQAAKRASLIASTRIFNGGDGAPRIVAVIPCTKTSVQLMLSERSQHL